MLARLLLLVLACAPVVRAQPADSLGLRFDVVADRQTNAQGYFFHVLAGEATKEVAVWGTVRQPGVYIVGADADLSEVLSLAGGPLIGPLADRNRRVVTVRVYRQESGVRAIAYEAPLDQMVREPGAHPVLRHGDVVEVETREIRARDSRDTLALITSVGTLAVIALQVVTLLLR